MCLLILKTESMSLKIPFLKDNHNHLFTYSSIFNNRIDLYNVHDKEKALHLLKQLADNKLNIAMGWLDNYYSFSTVEMNNLPPIILIHNSLHKYDFNNKAGEIIKDIFPEFFKNKNNQTWIEKNLMKILSFVSQLNKFDENIYLQTKNNFLNNGVCFVSDMYVDNIQVFEFLEKSNEKNFTEIWTEQNFYKNLSDNYRNLCRGFKFFIDGAIGAKSAAISESKIEWNSILNYTQNEFTNELETCMNYQKDIAIHCIGDIAIELALSSLNLLKQKINSQIRLEHVQFIDKKQAFKAKDLGLILSMQPNFNMDSEIYKDRLTKKYLQKNNSFRMLIDEAGFIPGKDLIFGSDGMPSGVFEAIQQSLFPPIESQKITVEEFVNAYCTDNYNNYIELEISNADKKVDCKIGSV